jgi:membrane protein required for beta-lactamase induction
MRSWLVAAMIAAAGTVIALMIVLYFPLRSFRRKHPVLRDEADMSAFKRLASLQMYSALPALYLTRVPLVVWLVGKFALGHLTWLDGLLFVVLPFFVQSAIAAGAIGTAEAVRSTPAANEALTAERDRVVDVWINKKLPQW